MPQNIEGSAAENADFHALRDQVHQTRAALARKLNLLQQRMTNSVESACNAADRAMDCASQGRAAVQTLIHALNVKQLAARHPCVMMSIATCVGVLLARRSPARSPSDLSDSNDGAGSGELRAQPTMKRGLSTCFQQEMGKLQNAAIDAGATLFRDWMDRAT